jgi:uncharacterized protein YifE (UPF0438 family)
VNQALWGVILPSALALTGVVFTALVGKRKNAGDERLQFIAVLQAERAASDGRADKAEARLERAERRARRHETLAWRYHQQLLRAGLEPDPTWPTQETEKVTV